MEDLLCWLSHAIAFVVPIVVIICGDIVIFVVVVEVVHVLLCWWQGEQARS